MGGLHKVKRKKKSWGALENYSLEKSLEQQNLLQLWHVRVWLVKRMTDLCVSDD